MRSGVMAVTLVVLVLIPPSFIVTAPDGFVHRAGLAREGAASVGIVSHGEAPQVAKEGKWHKAGDA